MEILTERSSRVVSYAKLHRAAVRRDEGRFLVEGANSVTAALETGRALVVLVRDDTRGDDTNGDADHGDADHGDAGYGRHEETIERARAAAVPVLVLNERACAKLSEAATPPGIFAVCALLGSSLTDVLAVAPKLLAVAVQPREPGNAGTLIRTADAMGADAVVLLGDSVDPHNGKCVRASAGSVFHLPIVRDRDISAALADISAAGITLLATAADGELSLADATAELAGPVAWMFGNEAHGLSPEIAATADHRVAIPLRGRAESLNLSTAAAICLYESAQAQLVSDQ